MKMVLEAKRSIRPFFYSDGQGNCSKISQWALFSYELGMALASLENKRSSVTLGLATPTRAYVAILITLGLIAGRGSPRDAEDDQGAFLDKVKSLPIGAPIEISMESRRRLGYFRGVQQVKGVDCIRIDLQDRHHSSRLFPLDDKLHLKIFGASDGNRPEERTSTCIDEKTRDDSAFSFFFVNKSQALDFALSDKLEYAIVGHTKVLKAELKEQIFAIKNDKKFAEGSLSTVLRESYDGEKRQSCRTRILSSRSCKVDVVLNQEMPLFTVFDGGLAFLKWGRYPPASNRIVILDRADTQFTEAVRTLTDTFTSRRTKVDLEFSLKTKLPPSMDVIAFVEETQ
ncbi:MAG: hypothetical protein ACP5M0_05500 [Desulfomonilaceae bacterium]